MDMRVGIELEYVGAGSYCVNGMADTTRAAGACNIENWNGLSPPEWLNDAVPAGTTASNPDSGSDSLGAETGSQSIKKGCRSDVAKRAENGASVSASSQVAKRMRHTVPEKLAKCAPTIL
jgi:hypothetical protein